MVAVCFVKIFSLSFTVSCSVHVTTRVLFEWNLFLSFFGLPQSSGECDNRSFFWTVLMRWVKWVFIYLHLCLLNHLMINYHRTNTKVCYRTNLNISRHTNLISFHRTNLKIAHQTKLTICHRTYLKVTHWKKPKSCHLTNLKITHWTKPKSCHRTNLKMSHQTKPKNYHWTNLQIPHQTKLKH